MAILDKTSEGQKCAAFAGACVRVTSKLCCLRMCLCVCVLSRDVARTLCAQPSGERKRKILQGLLLGPRATLFFFVVR